MRNSPFIILACAAAVAGIAAAQVLQLNLREMLERVDSGVVGTVTEKTTWSGPLEGFAEDPEFTTITVEGEDLVGGKTVKRKITYLGSEARPVSEMPNENETRVGSRGIYFSEPVAGSWGGRSGLNSLTTAQNGVFRVEGGRKGDVVIGKGAGAAVENNILLGDLRKQVAAELADIRRAKK